MWHFDIERHSRVGSPLAPYIGGPRINPFTDIGCTGIPCRVSQSLPLMEG